MEQYLIGDLLISFDGGGYRLRPGAYMERFRHDGSWAGETLALTAKFEPLTPYTEFPKLGSGEIYDLYDVNGERLLLYHWAYQRNAYGIWLDRLESGEICSFDPAILRQPPLDADWFFGICGLQRGLLLREKPVLHASYIAYNGGAILFAAPSQTGKSTQARLWEQYAGAGIVNGDRVLLGKRQGIWYAHGYPNCGSSDICKNISLPIRAIVILQQGQENVVHPLPPARQLRSLVTGFALHRWQASDMDLAFDLAQELASSVPVLGMTCRPDENAVETLRQYLEENDRGTTQ